MTRPAITGTVIAGTLRPADLLPAFIDALEQVAPDDGATKRLRVEVDRLDERGELDTDDGDEASDALMDALNAALPEGWYFGTTEGDGSDFGVWEYGPDRSEDRV